MHIHQAIIAKLTVKKIQGIIDHMQIVLSHHMGENPVRLTLQDWIDEARIHLRKLEHSVESAAE